MAHVKISDKSKFRLDGLLKANISASFENFKMPKKHGVLKIICTITDLCYQYANERKLNKNKTDNIVSSAYAFIEHKYQFIKRLYNKNTYESFEKYADSCRKEYAVAGVALVNLDKELLCVIKPEKSKRTLCLPLGKIEYSDNQNLKVTGFRELYEESGIKISKKIFSESKRFFEIWLGTKQFRLYVIEKFKKEVNLDHKSIGEVERLAWLNIKDVSKLVDVKYLSSDSKLLKTTFSQDCDIEIKISIILKALLKKIKDVKRNPFITVGLQSGKKKFRYDNTKVECPEFGRKI